MNRRVRFLEHVMGLDVGPEACRLAGEVTYVDRATYEHLARQRTRNDTPWIIDVDEDERAIECQWCDRLFWPSEIQAHRQFFHLATPKRSGEHECWCGDGFDTEHGLKVHQGRMHKANKAGPVPRSEGDREQGNLIRRFAHSGESSQ